MPAKESIEITVPTEMIPTDVLNETLHESVPTENDNIATALPIDVTDDTNPKKRCYVRDVQNYMSENASKNPKNK